MKHPVRDRIVMLLCALCALAGAVVMLCTNPFSNRNLLLLCGAFLWAVCGAAMFLLRGNLRMEECPAEQ